MSQRASRLLSGSAGLALAMILVACAPGEADRPLLIVNLAVDQLRPDMLDHYDPLFTGGLRRLRDEGLHHPDGTHDHAYTGTAVGHAALGTGVHPTRNGIVGNTWWEEVSPGQWRSIYAVQDSLSPILGFPLSGGRSPSTLYRGGIADWVLAHSPESRVVSLSGKDRGAIPMAGTARGEVYWMHRGGGRFVTSSWYRDEYPEWVTRFNEERIPVLFGDSIWESSIPVEAGPFLRRPDASPWEGDGVHTTFPHRMWEEATGAGSEQGRHNRWREATPALDRATLELTKEAVRELELGQRGVVDYLAVALSATDYVGHEYGPWSHEQLDNLLHLDRGLGDFFDFLDAVVGRGAWVLGFSSDHGVLDIPETREALGFPAGERLDPEDEARAVARMREVAEEFDDPSERAVRVAEVLEEFPFIAAAMPLHLLEQGIPSDSFGDLYRNSLSRIRITGSYYRAEVIVRLQEGMLNPREGGTTHTTVYHYDRWVPISFMGSGVPAGVSRERAATVDVAPTLAALARIPFPGDLDGRVLIP